LASTDVQTIINQAVARAVKISPNSVIAVTDREGYVLRQIPYATGIQWRDAILVARSQRFRMETKVVPASTLESPVD
jgi:hypothetical protein